MTVEPTKLPGVMRIQPEIYRDGRGYFIETYRASHYSEHGLDYSFLQDNVSVSTKGVLRGLHLQNPHGQAKLVYALAGEVFDACVDVRVGSPTFGKWYGEVLSAEKGNQLLIPDGFAHGFCVLSESAIFAYKCSATYSPSTQIAVRWDDPEIGITWPIDRPIVSEKDGAAPNLSELRDRLPVYGG